MWSSRTSLSSPEGSSQEPNFKMKTEKLILRNLIQCEPYLRKVLPYLTEALFENKSEQILFAEIRNYIDKYNSPPTKEALLVVMENMTGINQDQYNEAVALVDEVTQSTPEEKFDWLVDVTEGWVQDRTLHMALVKAIAVYDGTDKDIPKTALPELLSKALAVSFDPDVGHDYLEDADERFQFYHTVQERIPFDLEMLNTITNGGLPKKTLNVFVGGVNVGKSLVLCHVAAAALKQHKKVLYLTMEMSEESVSQRIDANLMGVTMQQVVEMDKAEFDHKIGKLKSNLHGKLIIKEFPTSAAGAHHFKAELSELKLKKQFIPDIVIIDYINICASSRVRMGNGVNTYLYIKMIAEELRGLAVEMKLPIVTATQLTRDGAGNSDPDMTDVAESFGLPATADWMVALIYDEQRPDMLLFKQIKTRYSNISKNTKFEIGCNRDKMQLFDPNKQSLKVPAPAFPLPGPEGRTVLPDVLQEAQTEEAMETIRSLHKLKNKTSDAVKV